VPPFQRYMRLRPRPSSLVSAAIIVAVFVMVAAANWREARRSSLVRSAPRASDLTRAGTATSRGALDRRIVEMDARLSAHPDDAPAAIQLADALLRQTRVTGNPGLSVRAERALEQALAADPGNYDAGRLLGTLYLSQHRFREAIGAGERSRGARPYDPVNY